MMVCLYCTRTAWEGFSLFQQQPNTSLAVLASVLIILKKQQLNLLSWRVISNGIIRYWAPSSCQRSQGIRGCSALFTQCSYTHLEWVLLSVLLPGLNKPRNCSDLAEEFHKDTQMPKSCCLQTLQLGGGGCAKEASPLPAVCAGGCSVLWKWCSSGHKPSWGSLEMWDLLHSIASKTVCSAHCQGRWFCNPHLTGIPAYVLLTTLRRSFIQMKRLAQA